jgi:hypothetical protein
MTRQRGNFAMTLAAVLVVGGASGGFIYYQTQQLQRAAIELASTQAALQQATRTADKAKADAEAARRELDAQKGALDQLRAERDSAKNLLDAERAHNERIRAELTFAQQQLVLLRSRPGAGYPPGTVAMPVEARPLRVVPAFSRPQAIGVGRPVQPGN